MTDTHDALVREQTIREVLDELRAIPFWATRDGHHDFDLPGESARKVVLRAVERLLPTDEQTEAPKRRPARRRRHADEPTVLQPDPGLPASLRLLREVATGPVTLTSDTTDPDRFLAEAIVNRVRTTYELHGLFGDDAATITGRTERRARETIRYHGGGITGGDKISTRRSTKR